MAKILEGAIRHDPQQAISYALLLTDKLERDGAAREARLFRSILSKAPARAVMGTSSSALKSPMDEESRLATVDIRPPEANDSPLTLSRLAASQVREFIETILAQDRLRARGINIPSRMLLHGAPGTGKTSIARLIAQQLNLPLVTTRSDALVSSLLGQTSKNIREVFDYASRRPCVLFLDEFDALAKNRADAHDVGELQRVVIALLENMDALDDSTVMIAATNHPQLLDPAVWRRFAHTLRTDVPNETERATIWANNLADVAVDPHDLSTLARYSHGMSGAQITASAMDVARHEVLANSSSVRLPHAMRRLARVLWYDDFGAFSDDASEARTLRTWAPEIFTLRALAEILSTNTRKISNYLKEDNDRPEPDSVTSLHNIRIEEKTRWRQHA